MRTESPLKSASVPRLSDYSVSHAHALMQGVALVKSAIDIPFLVYGVLTRSYRQSGFDRVAQPVTRIYATPRARSHVVPMERIDICALHSLMVSEKTLKEQRCSKDLEGVHGVTRLHDAEFMPASDGRAPTFKHLSTEC